MGDIITSLKKGLTISWIQLQISWVQHANEKAYSTDYPLPQNPQVKTNARESPISVIFDNNLAPVRISQDRVMEYYLQNVALKSEHVLPVSQP